MVVMEYGSIAKKEVKNNQGCCKEGPGYSSPLATMSGPRESLIYVTCVYTVQASAATGMDDKAEPQLDRAELQLELRLYFDELGTGEAEPK
ncbi:Selenium-binding protein 2 [Camellia lanceoleosa]|uniref:Selenium-binding protein 2 n=1 Tax=Camellia lanceoleosa TaxID=1840588 RepID=A0ACC0GUY8_9ERIC|nr:Selenium-binding protein 2 [Camellia lanceoleosa]